MQIRFENSTTIDDAIAEINKKFKGKYDYEVKVSDKTVDSASVRINGVWPVRMISKSVLVGTMMCDDRGVYMDCRFEQREIFECLRWCSIAFSLFMAVNAVVPSLLHNNFGLFDIFFILFPFIIFVAYKLMSRYKIDYDVDKIVDILS